MAHASGFFASGFGVFVGREGVVIPVGIAQVTAQTATSKTSGDTLSLRVAT